MRNEIQERNPLAPWAFGIFFLGLTGSFFLVQNLPFTFGDDLNIIYKARQVSWPALFKAVVNPFTPAWYVHGDESLLTTRAFQTFLFKGIFEYFGFAPNAFWAVKCLAFAGCGTLIYLWLYLPSGRNLPGMAGALFFYFLPPVYRSVSWIADPEVIVQFFVLTAFLFFFTAYRHKLGTAKMTGALAGLFITAWLGMKIKETARIIPFVLIAFLILDLRLKIFEWLKEARNRWLAAIALLLFIPAVPFFPQAHSMAIDARSGDAVSRISTGGLVAALLGIAGAFGLIAVATVAGRVLARKNRTSQTKQDPSALLFLFLWTAACLAGLGLNFDVRENVRYLTTVFVPLTLLVFYLATPLLSRLNRFAIFPVLVLITLFQFGRNPEGNWKFQIKTDEIIRARNWFGGIETADEKLTRKIYKDRFGVSEVSWQDLDNFYRGASGVPAFSKMKIKDWDENSQERLQPDNLLKMMAEEKAVYVLSFDKEKYEKDSRAKLIDETTTANGSLYSRLMARKKKSRRPVYLFKYAAPVSLSLFPERAQQP